MTIEQEAYDQLLKHCYPSYPTNIIITPSNGYRAEHYLMDLERCVDNMRGLLNNTLREENARYNQFMIARKGMRVDIDQYGDAHSRHTDPKEKQRENTAAARLIAAQEREKVACFCWVLPHSRIHSLEVLMNEAFALSPDTLTKIHRLWDELKVLREQNPLPAHALSCVRAAVLAHAAGLAQRE